MKYLIIRIIERFKARLVIQGFIQVYGVNFKETFVLIIRIDSLRILLYLITLEDIEVK